MLKQLLCLCAIAVGGIALLHSDGRRVQLTGLFSNLTFIEEGGDLVGMEVYVVQGTAGRMAVVQCAGGVPSDPVVVRVDAMAGSIRFTLPEAQADCGTEFEGKVTAKGLRGRFVGETEERWLPRKKGYWQ